MALSPFYIDEFDCDAEQLFDGSNSPHVERPAPAQIIRQIARCHASKWRQPLAKALMIGVDVLHVDNARRTQTYPFTGAQVDPLVGNPVLASEGPVSRICISHQQRLRIELRQQVLRQLDYRHCAAASDGIDRLAAAVARDQDAVELASYATPPCASAPFARRPVELARTFLRFEQEHFVGLDNAGEALWPIQLGPAQEAVTPAKCSVAMHVEALGRLAYGR